MNPDTQLKDFCNSLRSELPSVRWASNPIGVLSGQFDDTYRIRLSSSARLAGLFMGGLIPRDYSVLSEINGLVVAPLRVAERRPFGPVELRATWPAELSTSAQAHSLASDLNRVISGPLAEPHQIPIDERLISNLSMFITSTDSFKRIPAVNDVFEFIIGRGNRSLQVRVTQPSPEMVTFSTFITNQTASDKLTRRITTMAVFLLNSQLDWARFVLVKDSVINVEVAVPVSIFSTRVWQTVRKILYEGISHRRILRLVQQRQVAEEIERVWAN